MHRVTFTHKLLGACAIIAGSYLIAAFSNAAPVTQRPLTGRYSPGSVMVATPAEDPAAPDARPVPAEGVEQHGPAFEPMADHLDRTQAI